MSRKLRVAAPLALALSLSACMGGLLGGGGKAPPGLLTRTPQAPAPESVARVAESATGAFLKELISGPSSEQAAESA